MLISKGFTCLEANWVETGYFGSVFTFINLTANLEYIFVDEYQGVVENEYRLIKAIAGLGESEDASRSVQLNLCVIGDDDQNIYQFKGTIPEYIRQFQAEYKASQLILTENYRSTESIIEAANR